jgi:hypothetical protein
VELVRRVADIDSEDSNLVLDPVAWSAFWPLMRRSWWKRVWVLQDAFLAKKAIVNCGQIGVNIEFFLRLNGVKTTCWRRIEPRLRPVRCVPSAPFFVTLSDWYHCKASFGNGGIWLPTLLSMMSGFESKLKGDNILALLGLSTARDREITQIDYVGKGDLPDVLLSLRVAVYFLMRDRQHNCLLHLQMNQEPKSIELVSWVPDYTIHDPISHFILADSERLTTYSAGADNPAWARVSRTPCPRCQS